MAADIVRAERAARRILKEGGYQTPIDVLEIVRARGIAVEEQSLEDSVSGMLVIYGEDAIIGVNKGHHSNRKRFTIAHELGHFELHRGKSNVFVDAFLRSEHSSQGVDSDEIEANAFAAELLMPQRMLYDEIARASIDALDEDAVGWIAAKFGVSSLAMTIRLTKLGFIVAEYSSMKP